MEKRKLSVKSEHYPLVDLITGHAELQILLNPTHMKFFVSLVSKPRTYEEILSYLGKVYSRNWLSYLKKLEQAKFIIKKPIEQKGKTGRPKLGYEINFDYFIPLAEKVIFHEVDFSQHENIRKLYLNKVIRQWLDPARTGEHSLSLTFVNNLTGERKEMPLFKALDIDNPIMQTVKDGEITKRFPSLKNSDKMTSFYLFLFLIAPLQIAMYCAAKKGYQGNFSIPQDKLASLSNNVLELLKKLRFNVKPEFFTRDKDNKEHPGLIGLHKELSINKTNLQEVEEIGTAIWDSYIQKLVNKGQIYNIYEDLVTDSKKKEVYERLKQNKYILWNMYQPFASIEGKVKSINKKDIEKGQMIMNEFMKKVNSSQQ